MPQSVRGFVLLSLVLMAGAAEGCGGSSPGTGSDAGTMSDAGTGSDAGATPDAAMLPPDQVTVAQGTLQGAASDTGNSYVFKGIPYAAPPVGDLRFEPPAPPAPWSGTKDATAWPVPCMQTNKYEDLTAPVIGSEDCLYLNVWTPDTQATEPLPVMVFIHGGSGQWGATGAANAITGVHGYDGQYMAEHGGVVVVTIQYRLGILGFLAHPALSAETSYHGSGNYGHMDQVAALKWVQTNIAKFGGDPHAVTVFGESFGGHSVNMLLASAQAAGLFSGAITQSGDAHVRTLSAAEASGMDLAAAVGCIDMSTAAACLRAASAQSLAGAQMTAGTDVDGSVLTNTPLMIFQNHQENDVPWMIGSNADEAATLDHLFRNDTSLSTTSGATTALASVLVNHTGMVTPAVMTEASQAMTSYGGAEPTTYDALIAAATDFQFTAPLRRLLRAASGHTSPIYRYYYEHVFSHGPLAVHEAGHATELPFVFHNFSTMASYVPSADETRLVGPHGRLLDDLREDRGAEHRLADLDRPRRPGHGPRRHVPGHPRRQHRGLRLLGRAAVNVVFGPTRGPGLRLDAAALAQRLDGLGEEGPLAPLVAR